MVGWCRQLRTRQSISFGLCARCSWWTNVGPHLATHPFDPIEHINQYTAERHPSALLLVQNRLVQHMQRAGSVGQPHLARSHLASAPAVTAIAPQAHQP